MDTFGEHAVRPDLYQRFERPTPSWYPDAKLGIFVHWGPYSVPAWAEPIGPLGTFEPDWWMAHNPYAEWYCNTIRIEGCPAQAHQLEVHGDLDYERFLDDWRAERFDADRLMEIVVASGAGYVVPTAKHHDGVALWDAPGSGQWNSVRRGPKRDLVRELRDAAVARGLRFGVYYSGGLDWHFSDLPPITAEITDDVRPRDRVYADYAFDQLVDLIQRYEPAILWGDIDYPDAGKQSGAKSLSEVFDRFYRTVPDGVVNDRWGLTHWDFRTSEYVQGREAESSEVWENNRGIGFSFGYNQLEDETQYLSGPQAIRYFLDVVSRGGNLLLNVGPTAAGEIPPVQERTLRDLGAFNAAHRDAVFGSRRLDAAVAAPSESPWVRWTASGGSAHAFVIAPRQAELVVDTRSVDLAGLQAVGVSVRVEDERVFVATAGELPGRISFPLAGRAPL